MKKKLKTRLIVYPLSALTGVINSLLGAGGGMIAVPLLKKVGFGQKSAQANAIAVILPITLLSSAVYLYNGYVSIGDALPYVPGGLLGAFIGTKLLKNLPAKWIKRIFGILMLWAGIRLLMR